MDTELDPDTGSNLLASPVQASRPPRACLRKPKAPWGSAALGDTHAHCWLHRLSAPLNILRLPPNDPPGSAHATAARNGRSRHRDTSAGRCSSPRAPLGLHRPHPRPTPRPISRTRSEGSTGWTLSSPRFPGGGRTWLPAAPPDHSAGRSSETSRRCRDRDHDLAPAQPCPGLCPVKLWPARLRGSACTRPKGPGEHRGPVLTVPAGPAVAQNFSSDSATYLSANVKGSNFYQNYSSYFCLFFFLCKRCFLIFRNHL